MLSFNRKVSIYIVEPNGMGRFCTRTQCVFTMTGIVG